MSDITLAGTPMFQFLIGTIKTITDDEQDRSDCHVSIPYRYDKNADRGVTAEAVRALFQFLIGTIKTFQCNAISIQVS